MELTPQQKERLAKYLELSKYENGCYVFGPILRKDAQELYEIFTSVKVGYYASYVDRTVVNSDNSPIFVYAAYSQATKLLKVVSEITGKPLLADTYFTAPSKEKEPETTLNVVVIENPPKKSSLPKKDQLLGEINFDFSDMLKK